MSPVTQDHDLAEQVPFAAGGGGARPIMKTLETRMFHAAVLVVGGGIAGIEAR